MFLASLLVAWSPIGGLEPNPVGNPQITHKNQDFKSPEHKAYLTNGNPEELPGGLAASIQ